MNVGGVFFPAHIHFSKAVGAGDLPARGRGLRPGGERPLEIPGSELIRRLVLDNQVMVGSVNAARDHFQMAVDELVHARLLWGSHVAQLITNRHPYSDFDSTLHQHGADEIKAVIEWNA